MNRRHALTRLLPALLAALSTAACRPDPFESLELTRDAFEKGDRVALMQQIDSGYSDPLGDRERLAEDLDEIFESFPRRQMRFIAPQIVSRKPLTIAGAIEVVLEGAHGVKLIGPARWELERSGLALRIRSGFLPNLRDVEDLLARRRRALEANDVDAYGELLHPGYRDGDADRQATLARLAEDVPGIAIRISPIHHRIEVRENLTHVDERFRIRIGPSEPSASLARLTLEPSVGRWRIRAGCTQLSHRTPDPAESVTRLRGSG